MTNSTDNTQPSSELWYVLVEGLLEEEAAVGNFYAFGEHLGEAIANAVDAAASQGFKLPRAAEVYSIPDDFVMPAGVVGLNDRTLYIPEFHSYPAAELEQAFCMPSGIIHDTDDSGQDKDWIREAYHVFDCLQNDNGEWCMELLVGRARLKEIFFSLIGLLPSVNGLFVCMESFWEEREDELWGLQSSHKATLLDFLAQHPEDTLENGFVELAVTSGGLGDRTTLILDPHKHIRLFSKDYAAFIHLKSFISEEGFEACVDFHHIKAGYHHWHYRPNGARNRDGLASLLSDSGFERLAA